MPRVSGLATTSALTALENKIPDVSSLVTKKTDHDAKILDIESKYITTADYDKFTKDIADSSIKSKGLIDKSAMTEFINNADLDKKSSKINNKI